MTMLLFEIIWPERRVVDQEQIRTWYADAIYNGEVRLDENGIAKTTEGMAHALSDAGLITLGRIL